MIAAWVATVGPDPDPGRELRLRLERLRLRDCQRIETFQFGSLHLAAMDHPLLSVEPPSGTLLRLDERFCVLLSGAPVPTWLTRLPVERQAQEQLLSRCSGPWLICVIDCRRGRLRAYRDPLGDRALFSRKMGDQNWLASDEVALLDPDHRLDSSALAAHFALQFPPATDSPFESVRCLPAGHSLEASTDRVTPPRRYWQFQYQTDLRRCDDRELDRRFRHLLDAAIAQCQTDTTATAVAVSGGMDSPAIAASPALAGACRLYTYHFADRPDCDESELAREVAATTQRELHTVAVDDCGPLSSAFFDTPCLAVDFAADAYRALRHRLIRRVAENPSPVLLTGDFADQLYCGYYYGLRDLLAAGQWRAGLGIAGRRFAAAKLGALRDPLLRRVLPFNGVTRGWRRHRPDWVTSEACELLPPPRDPFAAVHGLAQPDRLEACLNSFTARGAHLGYLQGLAWGVELRFPFRNLALVEFMLSLPGFQLFDPLSNRSKAIARRALTDRLPASIIERDGKTSLEPLFRDQLGKHRQQTVQPLLESQDLWQKFVDRNWINEVLRSPDPSPAQLHTLWSCLSLALWQQQKLKLPPTLPIDRVRPTG